MGDRPITVYGAMAANAVIAVAKFAAAAASGSSALVAEGLHSLVDTGNQVLLLIGVRRSRKPPDPAHPFGYGKELYFWTLIVAVLLFAVGGGLSFYEGVHHLQKPTRFASTHWGYVVLGVAFAAEGISWGIAVRALSQGKGRSFLDKLRRNRDPTQFVVFAEDSAALLGIAIAAAGITASERLRSPWPDALASMVIGLILAGVAVYLALECRALLIGEGAHPGTVEGIQRLVASKPFVVEARRPLTMRFGPHELLVNLELSFQKDRSAAQIARDIEDLESSIRAQYPDVRRIFIEARSLREPLDRRNGGSAT